MKIAFIGQKGIPATSGGVEKRAENMAARLALLGHDVTCYVRAHYTPETLSEYRGVRLIHTRGIKTKHLDAITHTFTATLHAIFFEDFDVIHYHAVGPSVLSFLPRLLSPKVVVIGTFNSRDYFHKKWNMLSRMFLRFCEWAVCYFPHKTVVISKTLLEYAKEAYPTGDITLIQNGAEAHVTKSMDVLKSLDLKPKKYILSVSRLVRHKGIHYLIKAFESLKETTELPGNGYKLVIVGTHAETRDYVEYLRFMTKGNPDIILAGERFGAELHELFTHAAVFVQPSEDEGLSLALLEALSYGLPCVVSDIPANLEAIGDAGVSFENKNIPDLKRKLSTVINSQEKMAQLSVLARERAEKEYDWMVIAKRMADLYKTLLECKTAKHIRSGSILSLKGK